MTAPSLPRAPSTAALTSNALTERLRVERGSLRARLESVRALFVLAPLAIVVALSALLLRDGRWMTLPRVTPFVLMLLALIPAWFAMRGIVARFPQLHSLFSLAGTIETEQKLRDGSLRGALEVGHQGVLGAFAAQAVARRLTPHRLTPKLATHLRTTQLAGVAFALSGVGSLALAARFSPDGLSAMVHPFEAFQGTLLPALGFEKLPSSVPRGMPLRSASSASCDRRSRRSA